MSEFLIEPNVPLPQKTRRRKYNSKYPWAGMVTGDSFFVPFDGNKNKSVESLRSAVLSSGQSYLRTVKQNKHKVVVREVVEDDRKGVRAWLVGKNRKI